MSGRRGFTLTELVVITLVVLLACALATPVFLHVREAARRARCLSNLRHIGTALDAYVARYDNTYPLSMMAKGGVWQPTAAASVPAVRGEDMGFWANAIEVDTERLACEVANAPIGYAYNGYCHALNRDEVGNTSRLITVWEGFGNDGLGLPSPALDCGLVADPCGFAAGSSVIGKAPEGSVWTHGRGANFLFADGHAAWRRLGDRAGRPTDPQLDPFKVYDRSGRPDEFWIIDDQAVFFLPGAASAAR